VSTFRGPLFAIHAIFATVLVIALLIHLDERSRDIAHLKAVTTQERDETQHVCQDVDRQRALLQGLNTKDAYVIELLARERLQYSQPGEMSPPPAPTIDKLRVDGSK
jgi:cell division protein FtsB